MGLKTMLNSAVPAFQYTEYSGVCPRFSHRILKILTFRLDFRCCHGVWAASKKPGILARPPAKIWVWRCWQNIGVPAGLPAKIGDSGRAASKNREISPNLSTSPALYFHGVQ